MAAETPTISKMFAIFEPIAFAATTSGTPLNTATKDEMSSGKDVPTPTMVTPTIKGDKPRESPILGLSPKGDLGKKPTTANQTMAIYR